MDSHDPYGDNFVYHNWSCHDSKLSADMDLVFCASAPKSYSQRLERGQFPPVCSGPKERIRQEALLMRVFVAEADDPGPERRQAYLIQKLGPGGAGDPQGGSAILLAEGARCLLTALETAPDTVRPGFGTPVYHLAHLGFKQRLVDRGWVFDMHKGAPPPGLLKSLWGSFEALEGTPDV
eukprot:gnl/TRDRNA2_/TRDRNA2_102352_c2_seq1.p1 gnl/TRDRNA2_/TRDRNA2_102352_c2~~gnl/TRDRNA2_/TRDRNA2_102352_c2_seq1.p1  ORF type:complete len:209 (+),score=29.18 gnl/TRDRNA2_/TRDRNA2_102352_c2_seq1:93-629(+)